MQTTTAPLDANTIAFRVFSIAYVRYLRYLSREWQQQPGDRLSPGASFIQSEWMEQLTFLKLYSTPVITNHYQSEVTDYLVATGKCRIFQFQANSNNS